jgi:hypothetical protein
MIRTRTAFLFLFLWLFSYLSAQPGQMETVPVGDKSYEWIYDYLEKLYLRGCFKEIHLGTKPYYRGEIASSLLNLKNKIEKEELKLSSFEKYLFHQLENEFEPEMITLDKRKRLKFGLDFLENSNLSSNRKSIFYESFLPSLQADIGDNFSFLCRYSIDEGLAKDSTYAGKIWRGFAGDATQAYLSFKLPYFNLFIGRENLSWGQSRLSPLILSPNSPSMDMLKLQGEWSFFKLSSFFAQLDPLTISDSAGTNKYRRYLSAHRFSFKVRSFLELGLSETVIYGGENRWFELYYLNPLLWFHASQLNENEDDNTFFGIDFNFSPLRKLLLYGEFLIDDLQIEKKTSSDREPNELGYSLGVKLGDFLGLNGSELDLEYIRINNWTYNQKNPWNRYTYKNKLIGSPLGPDADNLLISIGSYLKKGLEAKISYELTRRGEGRINSSWDEPWLYIEDYKESFPSGIVEKTDKFQLSLNYNFKSIFRANLFFDYVKISNSENVSGSDEELYGFTILLHYHFVRRQGAI